MQDTPPTSTKPSDAADTRAPVARYDLWLPVTTVLAFACGYYWYADCQSDARHRFYDDHEKAAIAAIAAFPDSGSDEDLERRISETQKQYGSYLGPGQGWEWLTVVAAAVLYGAYGWRWLGGWLILPQVVGLVCLATTSLGRAHDAMTLSPEAELHNWAYAAQGGALAGIVAALGIGLVNRPLPCQPLTLRRIFLVVLLVAAFLVSVNACVEWRYGEDIARAQHHRESFGH